MIDFDRLIAPRENLGLLIEPSPAIIRAILEEPSLPEHRSTASILGKPIAWLRLQLRERLRLRARVVVSGHQAEFFHPGVFAKIIAADLLSQQEGAAALFLMVDSDLRRTGELVIPQKTHNGLRRVSIPFAAAGIDLPVECQPLQNREFWLDFFSQAGRQMDAYEDSLLPDFARGWLDTDEDPLDFCRAMMRGIAAIEAKLRIGPSRMLTISALCDTPEFLAFAGEIMLRADQFAACYNAAQADYRRQFRERNPQRPVPPLKASGGRVELPFWVYQRGARRRRFHVFRSNDRVELLADDDAIGSLAAESFAEPGDLADGWKQSMNGWLLRPRALALSCVARLLLGDLFIHGIGGARYDAMMEQFCRAFFGVEPDPMTCVTATMYLPLPAQGVANEDLRAVRRESRDLRFNPQRHLTGIPATMLALREELVRRSQILRENEPWKHADRRIIYGELRRLIDTMLKADPWRAAAVDQRMDMLKHGLELNRIALDREYFVGLHRTGDIEALTGRIRALLTGESERVEQRP